MKEKKQILSVATDKNYYLYDCINGHLYPCTEIVYVLCDKYTEKELLCKQISAISDKIEADKSFLKFSRSEILDGLNFIVKFLSNINKMKKQLNKFEYPAVGRVDVVKSLASVRHITLEVTKLCNLSCTYCCYGDIYKYTQGENNNSSENIVSYINTILDLKNHYNMGFQNLIISFYGGEPLLRFDIIERVVKLVKFKVHEDNVTFSMTTNGVLLHQYIGFLVENNFKLLISLDGNEINNSYRVFHNGKNSFKRVDDNVLLAFKKYPEYFKRNIDFSTVLHDKNECVSVCDFFDKYEKVPSFSFLSKDGVKPSQKKAFNNLNATHRYTNDEVRQISISHPQIYSMFFTNNDSKDTLFQGKDTPESFTDIFHQTTNYPDGSCFLFKNRAFIDVNGYLYLCEKANRTFRFGRISTSKIAIYTKRINQYYELINSIHRNKCLQNCYNYFCCKECYFSDCTIVEKLNCRCDVEQTKRRLVNIISQEERRLYE